MKVGAAAWMLAIGVALVPRAASAFGGVFFPTNQGSSNATATHRVALAVQKDGNVAWDQIAWTQGTKSVAWVLPIRPGATSELTGDAFFAALAGTTEPSVYSPPDFGPAATCALTGCSQDTAFGSGPDSVSVKQQATAAPVESLVIKGGADGSALVTWLGANGFAVPSGAGTAIAAYAREGWDFQVHRFVPDCNVNASRVARITTRGGDPAVLPTRLLVAGTAFGTFTTFYTFGTTRLAPAGVSTQTIDADRLLWRDRDKKSNYDELASEVTTRGALLTEFAAVPTLTVTTSRLPSVYDVYPGLCKTASLPSHVDVTHVEPASCTSTIADAGVTPDTDASSDAGADADAEADAGAPPAPEPPDAGPRSPVDESCATPDDLTVALRGDLDTLHTVLTRMRGAPSAASLASSDLRFVATTGLVSNQLQAVAYDPSDRPAGKESDPPNRSAACGAVRRRAYASWTAVALTLVTMATAWARRRGRPR